MNKAPFYRTNGAFRNNHLVTTRHPPRWLGSLSTSWAQTAPELNRPLRSRRLDSVRVLHYSALRDCRKSLIKRAIALQELLIKWWMWGPTDEDQHQATHGTQDTVSDSVVGSSEMFVADSEEEGGQVGCEEHEESKKMEALRNEEKMGVEEKEEDGGDGGKMELLERMMEDNQKMMEMMAQLFERNEMQTRLLSSLTQRVEQLERTYACDK
ncbi:golgin subfamily A member 6-like protein 6 [Sesbania bispinosa]|nr:golgin subfamily A member 6-like protein 6 [Sesbania bispinosa]